MGLLAVAGYFELFSRFEYYDDEGYIALSIEAFLRRGSLYGDVYSQYGPFPYELWGALFEVTGAQVSSNAIRLLTLAIWLGISLTAGITAHRLTRRWELGLVCTLLSFAAADSITREPLHPDGLITLLILGVGAAAALLSDRRPRAAMAIGGALLAAAILTKVNVGGLGIAAVLFALAATAPTPSIPLWARASVVGACIALPVVLMLPDLQDAWAQNFALSVAFGIVALAIVALRLPAGAQGSSGPDPPSMLALGAGFAATALLIIGVIVATGTSLAELIDGVILEPLGQRDVFTFEAKLPSAIVDLTLAGCVAAFVARRAGSSGERSASAVGAVLRILAGLVLLLGTASALPIQVVPAPTALGLAIPLAWISAAPPVSAGSFPSPYVRVLLPALALLGALHAYPVFGSQAGLSAVAFVPVGALVLADGLGELEASSTTWAGVRGVQLASVVTVALAALIVKAGAQSGVQPTFRAHKDWAEGQALPFYGASRIRLPAAVTSTYAGVVDQLRRRCDSFVTLPGMNSFYLWTGMDPPSTLNATSWMYLLDGAQQQRVVNAARGEKRLCALRNDRVLDFWVNQGPPPKRLTDPNPLPGRPLYRFITEEFRTVTTIGDYQIMVRKL